MVYLQVSLAKRTTRQRGNRDAKRLLHGRSRSPKWFSGASGEVICRHGRPPAQFANGTLRHVEEGRRSGRITLKAPVCGADARRLDRRSDNLDQIAARFFASQR
jgi:hypothetical protein